MITVSTIIWNGQAHVLNIKIVKVTIHSLEMEDTYGTYGF